MQNKCGKCGITETDSGAALRPLVDTSRLRKASTDLRKASAPCVRHRAQRSRPGRRPGAARRHSPLPLHVHQVKAGQGKAGAHRIAGPLHGCAWQGEWRAASPPLPGGRPARLRCLFLATAAPVCSANGSPAPAPTRARLRRFARDQSSDALRMADLMRYTSAPSFDSPGGLALCSSRPLGSHTSRSRAFNTAMQRCHG